MKRKKNVGFVDQFLRALLILDLIVPCLLGVVTGGFAFVLITLAAVPLMGCVTSYCWLYDVLNVSTYHT